MAAAAAGGAELAALAVAELDQRRVGAGRKLRRVVELVAAHGRAGRSERTVGQHPRLAIAEMKPSLGKARRVAQEPGHGVARAVRVLKTFAQNHVAAAFAMHEPRRGEARQAGAKALRRAKLC